jgi:hypothetical protein
MRKVMFWSTGDTVVNAHRPADTYTVTTAESRPQGTWIKLEHNHYPESFSGFEIGLQGLGYVGYR